MRLLGGGHALALLLVALKINPLLHESDLSLYKSDGYGLVHC